ncbi:hypothetical protein [Alteromonas gilva]|uniref:Uncharacterized protein n=1 Tax=Alteromonas gilva TaxID=2987522 RepID=A0ABT5L5H6_9ALTE|nr:hypothetical protein [Alteromonas gilva]MDC8832295.1 hypothetical protein [Alteromonas gilva]
MLLDRIKTILVVGILLHFMCGTAQAQSNNTLVIYDDELKNEWQNWSFADVNLSVPVGGIKPIKVAGEAWSALAFHHAPLSLDDYNTLTFFINGGLEGGQTLSVKLVVDGEPLSAGYVIQPKAKSWALAEVPLKELDAEGKKIDGVWLQAQDAPYSAYYITKIQFE